MTSLLKPINRFKNYKRGKYDVDPIRAVFSVLFTGMFLTTVIPYIYNTYKHINLSSHQTTRKNWDEKCQSLIY